jgi:hypothetical protein
MREREKKKKGGLPRAAAAKDSDGCEKYKSWVKLMFLLFYWCNLFYLPIFNKIGFFMDVG